MKKHKKPFARKRFGQNFLEDSLVIDNIIDSADLKEGDHVIEIGPGRGALTRKLLEKNIRLTAIEIDNDLTRILKAEFGGNERFRLINEDVLNVDWQEIVDETADNKVIANLPYNISTPLFFRFVTHRHHFSSFTIMLQKEVAERICHDGTGKKLKDYGILSVIADSVFHSKILFDVSPECFYPVPKVSSAVIQLKPEERQLVEEERFFDFVKRAFNLRRKLFLTHLKKYEVDLYERLTATDLDYLEGVRAENLVPQQFRDLYYRGTLTGEKD